MHQTLVAKPSRPHISSPLEFQRAYDPLPKEAPQGHTRRPDRSDVPRKHVAMQSAEGLYTPPESPAQQFFCSMKKKYLSRKRPAHAGRRLPLLAAHHALAMSRIATTNA